MTVVESEKLVHHRKMPLGKSKPGKSGKNQGTTSNSKSELQGEKKSKSEKTAAHKHQKSDHELYKGVESGPLGQKSMVSSKAGGSSEGAIPKGKTEADKAKRYESSTSKSQKSTTRIPVTDNPPVREVMSKIAGETHQASRRKELKASSSKTPPINRLSEDRNEVRAKAAEAALSRLDFSKSMGFAKERSSEATANQLAVDSVLYACPPVSNELLKSNQWRPKIISYLSELSRTDKEMSAVLTVHTLNTNKEKVEECVQILNTYLKNILSNPDDEKYRSIKMSNKAFAEKVIPIKGAIEFLNAAGFRNESKIDEEGGKVDFLYLSGKPDSEKLEMLSDAIRSAEPLLPTVYRNPTVLKPREAEEKIYLPDDFYDLTEKELTDMYRRNLQKLEKESPLMTKAMRDKEDRKHLAKYKYSLLRVRFPDTIFLQGTFSRYDTQKSIKEFVDSCLVRPIKYSLYSTLTRTVLTASNDEKTLYDLKLIPSVVLNFIPEDKDKFPKVYLKAEILKNIKKI